MGYAMHFQHRSQMGIVDLNAAYLMSLHQSKPRWKDRLNFFQKRHVPDNGLESPACLLDRQAKAIAIRRASAHIPEFTKILRGVAQFNIPIRQAEHAICD